MRDVGPRGRGPSLFGALVSLLGARYVLPGPGRPGVRRRTPGLVVFSVLFAASVIALGESMVWLRGRTRAPRDTLRNTQARQMFGTRRDPTEGDPRRLGAPRVSAFYLGRVTAWALLKNQVASCPHRQTGEQKQRKKHCR